MDISTNSIDLQYLTNPLILQKLNRTSNITSLSKDDLLFYRKRIFQITKYFLQGKEINSTMNKTFQNYAQTCIRYFKFMDKAAIIQQDYKGLPKQKRKCTKLNMKDNNKLIMKKKPDAIPKITDHIHIKSIHNIQPKNMIIPIQRKINLKDPKLKNKNIEKLIGK